MSDQYSAMWDQLYRLESARRLDEVKFIQEKERLKSMEEEYGRMKTKIAEKEEEHEKRKQRFQDKRTLLEERHKKKEQMGHAVKRAKKEHQLLSKHTKLELAEFDRRRTDLEHKCNMVKKNHDILLEGYNRKLYVVKKMELEHTHAVLKKRMKTLSQQGSEHRRTGELVTRMQEMIRERDLLRLKVSDLCDRLHSRMQEKEEMESRENNLPISDAGVVTSKESDEVGQVGGDMREEEHQSESDDEKEREDQKNDPQELERVKEQQERDLQELLDEKNNTEETTQLLREDLANLMSSMDDIKTISDLARELMHQKMCMKCYQQEGQ